MVTDSNLLCHEACSRVRSWKDEGAPWPSGSRDIRGRSPARRWRSLWSGIVRRQKSAPLHIYVLLNSFWNQQAIFSAPPPPEVLGLQQSAIGRFDVRSPHTRARAAESGRRLVFVQPVVMTNGCCAASERFVFLSFCLSGPQLQDSGGSFMVPPFSRWTPSTPWNPPCLPLHTGTHAHSHTCRSSGEPGGCTQKRRPHWPLWELKDGGILHFSDSMSF